MNLHMPNIPFPKKKIGFKEVGLALIGLGLALLLPTPILLIVGGSWLGWKGMKQKQSSDKSRATSSDQAGDTSERHSKL